MPTEIQALPAPDAAKVLHEQIYVPTFFSKLASLGVKPRSAQEVEQLLRIGDHLLVKYSQARAKEAAAAGNFLSQLEQELATELGEPTGFVPATANHPQIKQASDQLAHNPQLAHAVISRLSQQAA
jgi:hypothetical protein